MKNHVSTLKEREAIEVSFTIAARPSETADGMKKALEETAENLGATCTITENEEWLVQFRWAGAAAHTPKAVLFARKVREAMGVSPKFVRKGLRN
jgi:hypothetical protein